MCAYSATMFMPKSLLMKITQKSCEQAASSGCCWGIARRTLLLALSSAKVSVSSSTEGKMLAESSLAGPKAASIR